MRSAVMSCDSACLHPDYTPSGHVVGMLDRDQRTAKTRCDPYPVPAVVCHCFVHPQPTPFRHRRRKSYLWSTLRRLQQALIAGIYLLSLVSVPCSLSAPAHHKMARDASYPKWTMPCGPSSDNGVHDVYNPVTDSDILMQIVGQADIALNNAVKFKEDFADQLFGMNSDMLHENWKTYSYDWLPKLHKGFNEKLPPSHLDSLTLDQSLINVYTYLQKVAVGLEQVVKDQEEDQGPFLLGFNQSEHNLLSVLCEIQTAILERNLKDKMEADVTRDIMPNNLRVRDGNMTARNVRDWIIYRDYMNALQYVIQIFDYFKSKL